MNNLKIVTVVNNFDCFDRTIANNKFMNKYDITIFDNKKENIGISKRYNSFINDQILSNKIKDSWIVFCHQDFAFLEDTLEKLKNLNTNSIYGPTGVKKRFRIDFRKRERFLPIKYKRTSIGAIKQGFRSSNYFTLNHESYFKDNNSVQFSWAREELLRVGDELFFTSRKQLRPKKEMEVDSLDCCCLIVHSSLIKNFNLKFDENLDFHLYSEDFSFNARFNHKILTKVIQFNCFHRGSGTLDQSFYNNLSYVKNKYKGKRFVGTCFNCDW